MAYSSVHHVLEEGQWWRWRDRGRRGEDVGAELDRPTSDRPPRLWARGLSLAFRSVGFWLQIYTDSLGSSPWQRITGTFFFVASEQRQ